MARTKAFAWLIFALITVELIQTGSQDLQLQFDTSISNPYFDSVYVIVGGSLKGLKVFAGHSSVDLNEGDFFTVVVTVDTRIEDYYNEKRGWYELPAVFCLGDDNINCVNIAKNSTAERRKPYLIPERDDIKLIPFMVPFTNFTYDIIMTQNGTKFPKAGTVHPEFQSFKYSGASYSNLYGTLTSFYAANPNEVGAISSIYFRRKNGQRPHQQLIECRVVEWAHDGCVPGLSYLLKGWNMKNLRTVLVSWLKKVDFPPSRDEDYIQTLDYFQKGSKNFLVPKGLFLQKVEDPFIPYSKVYANVKALMNDMLVRFGVGYKKETTEVFRGSGKVQYYSQFFSGRTHSSAVAGMSYRLYSASFTGSFDFGDRANWDLDFKRDLAAMLESRDSSKATDFFNDYGTHYIKSAVMGGRKESVFSVDYCSLEKGSSLMGKLETSIKLIYDATHNISTNVVFERDVQESVKKKVVSGPDTTCIGGRISSQKECENDIAWQYTVLDAPCPIELVIKPFWKLLGSDENEAGWLKNEYEKYLLGIMDEEEIKADLGTFVQCDGARGVLNACYTTIIAAAVVLIVLRL